jgi:hypothetical protein
MKDSVLRSSTSFGTDVNEERCNAIRPLYLKPVDVTGPERRGQTVAALFYSLIESAKLCGVDPKAYLLTAARAALANRSAVTLPHDLL